MNSKLFFLLICAFSFLSSCKQNTKPSATLFKKLSNSHTNVNFTNTVTAVISNSILNNNNIYAGGGIAIGDINNDGLPDFIAISNQNEPGLYLNQGDFKFENISKEAGLVATRGWSTGVVMEDINADGWLDIYISKGIYTDKNKNQRKNLLYINNKNNTFSEQADEYGIANSSPSVQSVFFDFDLDGDLDLYVLNQPLDTDTNNYPVDQLGPLRQNNPVKENSDAFYLNLGNNKFEDASQQVGIHNYGNGLGIGIADLTKNGYPDIYITNDFDVDNFLYVNNNGKNFSDYSKTTLNHVSYFAMGCDLSDINNDGLIDIFEVEMLPKERKRSIQNMASMNRNLFENFEKNDFVPQYMRNSLQINRGRGKFSEIAQIAGIAKTDWSWGCLLIDADDDGYKDIFVTNGIKNDIKDRDYARKGNKLAEESNGSITWEQHLSLLVSTKVPNYAFRNQKNTLFEDVSKEWGFYHEGFSNGFSYGDLDLDGDLDLIVNNLDESPWIYENNSRNNGQNMINFKLKGSAKNTNGIGAKLTIYTNENEQYAEHYTVRGFQSSSQHIIHFGLGKSTQIDSLKVVWPDGKIEKQSNRIQANKTYTLDYKNASIIHEPKLKVTRFFNGSSRLLGLNSTHKEIIYDDYKREILLPHKMSQFGPALATGDVNSDGIEDIYIGGAASFAPSLFISNTEKFSLDKNPLWDGEKKYEDIAATFFDADKDGDKDLYVVSGSNEFQNNSDYYNDRLYLNDGTGKFSLSLNALPNISASGGCVEAADYDNDGDQDLFIGTRMLPGKYPMSSSSYILENNGGKFTNKTNKINPELESLGMVTSAKWADYDKDGDEDLFIVGEWMGIKLFENNNGKLKNISNEVGLENTEGWWFHIGKLDLDQDGDIDFICGNIGENHKFKPTVESPLQIFSSDFDENGTQDIVLAFHQENKFYPVRGRDCSSEQMPFIKEKFPTFASYGDAQMEDIFGSKLDKAYKLKSNTFSSYILKNNNGQFEKIKLPVPAQYSAITGAAELDINDDGINDLVVAGNMFHTEAETSKADASFGLSMIGDGTGNYKPVTLEESGFFTPGDVKQLRMIDFKGNKVILVANNNARFQSYMHIVKPNLK